MKYIVFCFLLFFCKNSFSQDKFEVAAEYASSDSLGSGVGGHFSLSKVISGKISVGGSITAVRFEQLESMYYPISVKVKLHPTSAGVVKPFMLAEAGYGIYSHTENFSSTNRYSSKGGLTYFGGAGLSLRLVNIHPTLTLGYSAFTLKTIHHTQSVGVEYVSESSRAFGGFRARLGIGF